MDDIVGAKFYCPRALANSNRHIEIREKMLEFSSTVLSTLSPFTIQISITRLHNDTKTYSVYIHLLHSENK